jgi:hypothetical protein
VYVARDPNVPGFPGLRRNIPVICKKFQLHDNSFPPQISRRVQVNDKDSGPAASPPPPPSTTTAAAGGGEGEGGPAGHHPVGLTLSSIKNNEGLCTVRNSFRRIPHDKLVAKSITINQTSIPGTTICVMHDVWRYFVTCTEYL